MTASGSYDLQASHRDAIAIEAPGAVFTGGSPMSDAVVFAQWRAARRLLERGALTTIWQAAALGQLDAVCANAWRRPNRPGGMVRRGAGARSRPRWPPG